MPLTIDENDSFGARAAAHLREDPVAWLTTVGTKGAPAPNPVWFLWDGADSLLVYTLPDSDRLRHLEANPQVSVNFAGDGRGGDIVVLSGTAAPAPGEARADENPAYRAKYDELIVRIGHTAASFADRYSVPVRVTLTRLRGH